MLGRMDLSAEHAGRGIPVAQLQFVSDEIQRCNWAMAILEDVRKLLLRVVWHAAVSQHSRRRQVVTVSVSQRDTCRDMIPLSSRLSSPIHDTTINPIHDRSINPSIDWWMDRSINQINQSINHSFIHLATHQHLRKHRLDSEWGYKYQTSFNYKKQQISHARLVTFCITSLELQLSLQLQCITLLSTGTTPDFYFYHC